MLVLYSYPLFPYAEILESQQTHYLPILSWLTKISMFFRLAQQLITYNSGRIVGKSC